MSYNRPNHSDTRRRFNPQRIVRLGIVGSGLLLVTSLILALAPGPLPALRALWPQDALSYAEPKAPPAEPVTARIQPTRSHPNPPRTRPVLTSNEPKLTPTAAPVSHTTPIPPTPTPTQRVRPARHVRLAHPVQSGQTIRSAQFLTPTKTAPWHLQIPAIDLTAPVIGAELTTENAQSGPPVFTWTVPDYAAAGWHVTSAPPGKPGNTVLNGHNNIKGEVFRDLVDVQTGDRVILDATGNRHEYLITDRHIVREAGASLETRIDNARWVAATADERLTLVTCWPPTGDSHRLIVIARPIRSPVKPLSSLPTMR